MKTMRHLGKTHSKSNSNSSKGKKTQIDKIFSSNNNDRSKLILRDRISSLTDNNSYIPTTKKTRNKSLAETIPTTSCHSTPSMANSSNSNNNSSRDKMRRCYSAR